MQCIECAQGFHVLCRRDGCASCHDDQSGEDGNAQRQTSEDIPDAEDGDAPRRKSRKGQKLDPDRPRTRDRKKNDLNLKDPKSTGRKRAVNMHGHADPEKPCEWRDLANCGGGRFPIMGCVDGVQESLHHGPDKNTLNNDRLNIHKICYRCHNRWHTLNDPDYNWEGVHEPHSPREPTREDMREDLRRWANRQIKRARD